MCSCFVMERRYLKETLEALRKEYPIGSRVELVRMDDVQAPPICTRGTVKGVDDIGYMATRIKR